MQNVVLLIQICVFLLLAYTYYKVCTHRTGGITSKVVELIGLYSVSVVSIVGKFKFSAWVAGIAVVGIIKILTTKKIKIEREHT